MARPDHSIDPCALGSAKKEFLLHGFEKASLKAICESAGITTGALYKRYKGREDLFCTVVENTVADLNDVIEEKCAIAVEDLSDKALVAAQEMNESMLWWFCFLYERHDDSAPLLQCAEGTKYTNFQHDWVGTMTGKGYEYFLEAKRRGLTRADISIEEMHILLSAFQTTIYEPFIHGFILEQIEAHCELICGLFNWQRVLGFPLSTEPSYCREE